MNVIRSIVLMCVWHESSPICHVQMGVFARATVQWNGKDAIPCSAWCRVTVRGCVMFLGYWLNDLGLHDKSLNPCRLSVCWQRNVSSTCLHIDPRTLLNWHVHIPKVSPPEPRNNLFTISSVSHALVTFSLAAIQTVHLTCSIHTVQHIIHCHSGLKSQGTVSTSH